MIVNKIMKLDIMKLDIMKILDGKKLSEEIQHSLKKRVEILKHNNIIPGLAIILVGENPESLNYIKYKQKACLNVGMKINLITLPENIDENILIDEINKLNNNDLIHGIIIQLPLPRNLNENNVLSNVSQNKDVDGFHEINAGNLFLNRDNKRFIPCTPLGCIELIDHYKIDMEGLNITIIGCSNLVGLPLSVLLLQRNATITLCNKYTQNIKEHTLNSDLIISCCGVPHLVKRDWIKQDVIIIDVGTTMVDGKVIGDVDFENVKDMCSYITPVPGGVGPMTITSLLKQTIEAAESKL